MHRQEDRDRHAIRAQRMDKKRHGLTLRFALLALLSLFGLGLVVVVATNGAGHLRLMQTYRLEKQIEQTRQAIRSAYIEVETAARHLDLLALNLSAPDDINASVKLAVDHIATARALASKRGDETAAGRLAAQEEATAALFGRLRATSDSINIDRPTIDRQLSAIATELTELRRGTLGEFHIADAQMALVHLVRDQTIAEHRDLDTTTAIIVGMLAAPSSVSADAFEILDSALIRIQAPALDLFTSDDTIILPDIAFQALSITISQGLAPSLVQLIGQVTSAQVDSESIANWQEQITRTDTQIRKTLAEADKIALDHIDARIEKSWQDAVIAMIGGSLVLLLYVLSIIMILRRLIAPMTRLRGTLMRLAQGDLRPIRASNSPFTDVQAVIEALRVFRIDAIQRERLRWERLELTTELTAANREMRADLEAAAALQLAQLPSPATIGNLRFSTYFQASSHLGGDSFDFFQLPDGRIIMFQLDVAGHGTASSLVAIAAHTTIKRALHELEDGQRISDLLEKINGDWKPDLPYFTAVLMSFDPTGKEGTMVQAGHPYPLLLRLDHDPESIGMGALPVGVHDAPGYEDYPLSLKTGDRLFVFSDGIYEIQDTEGAIFGEDRLCDLIGELRALPTDTVIDRMMSALRSWAGTDELDDDISLVVMEKLP